MLPQKTNQLPLALSQKILKQSANLAEKTKFVLEQYLQTLKSMLNENKEIEDIAKKLYKRYKSAFDLVFKYSTPNDTSEIGIFDTNSAGDKTNCLSG